MKKGGQAASEYLGIIIIVLIILIPILILYIRYSGETKDAVVSSKVDSITNEITKATNQVFVYGPGTQSTVTISFPENIDYVEFSNKDVTFHLINSKGQPYKLAKVTDTNFRPGIFYDLPSGKINLKFKTCDEGAVEVCLANTNQCTTRCTTSQNLVLNFNFNADIGNIITDSSSYKNDGTLNGGAALQTSGCINGNCYKFGGDNDYINVPSIQIPTNSFTYSLWFKPSSPFSSISPRQDFIYTLTDGRPHLTFNKAVDGKIGIYVTVNGGTYDDIKTTTNAWSSNWYYLTVTWDGTDFKIYVNGILENTITHSGTHSASTGINVGATKAPNSFFNGYIDEVRIYNYALSQQDIQNYYNINKP